MTSESGGGGNRVSGGPRAEARPLDWHEMTEDQRRATREILGLVDAMAKEPAAGKKEQDDEDKGLDLVLPRLDEVRSNRVVLIEGSRGMGKTAVLVSVLGHWSSAVRRKKRAEVTPSFTGHEAATEVLKRVYEDARVVPLEILDLQPLPRSTHLLAHIAARLRPIVRLIEQSQGGAKGNDRAPWQDSDRRCSAEEAWSDFTRTVAVGWDDTLKARSSTLDLESYVDEQRQTESDRMDVRATFTRLMDRLVEDFAKARGWGTRQPFFVLPVDDADMNALRVPELVEILRMLWHPRLAFVVTGDGALFEMVLYHYVLNDIQRSGTRGLEHRSESMTLASERKANDLARQMYRKAVPQNQRFELPEIPSEARWSMAFDAGETSWPRREPRRLSLNDIVTSVDYLVETKAIKVAGYLNIVPSIREAVPGNVRDHAGALTRRACFWSVQNLTEVFLDASPDAPLAVGPPAVAGPRRRVAPLGSDRARPARSLRPAGWRPVVRRGSSRPRAPLRPGPRRLGRVEA